MSITSDFSAVSITFLPFFCRRRNLKVLIHFLSASRIQNTAHRQEVLRNSCTLRTHTCFVLLCFFVGMSHPAHIQTHKSMYRLTNQIILKSTLMYLIWLKVLQLLYGSVLVIALPRPSLNKPKHEHALKV